MNLEQHPGGVERSKPNTTPHRGSAAIRGPATEFFEPGPWQDFDKVVRWDGVQGYENDTLPEALERARAYTWRLATELDGDDDRLPHWWQHRPAAGASRVEILDRILERHWTALEVRHPGAFSRLRTEVEALRQTADRFDRGDPVDVQGAAYRLHEVLAAILRAMSATTEPSAAEPQGPPPEISEALRMIVTQAGVDPASVPGDTARFAKKLIRGWNTLAIARATAAAQYLAACHTEGRELTAKGAYDALMKRAASLDGASVADWLVLAEDVRLGTWRTYVSEVRGSLGCHRNMPRGDTRGSRSVARLDNL